MAYRPSRGVYYDKRHDRWIVRLSTDDGKKYLGSFKSEEEAWAVHAKAWSEVPVKPDNITGASEIDLAWAAGIIDGEGTIIIQRKNPPSFNGLVRYELFLAVGMIHKPTIERLHAIFGRGYVMKRRNKGQRVIFHWHVRVNLAAACLRLVLPYLVTKKSEAELALEFDRARGVYGGRITPSEDEMALRESYRLRAIS